MARPELPPPPSEDAIRGLKRNARIRSRPLERLSVELVTTTPIFGGGVAAGQPDSQVPIRVPAIRGQLRFWWRALQPAGVSVDEMRDEERRLFGGAAGAEGSASDVVVTVSGVKLAGVDESSPSFSSADGYALFPARGERGQPVKPRWKAGLKFTLRVDAPPDDLDCVRRTILAWILFGGYGARTRRGLGALGCATEAARHEWLPAAATAQALMERLGRDVFANPKSAPSTVTPRLAAATLLAGSTGPSASSAWTAALGMLRMFRQGEGLARDQGQGGRPGRSRWPEADKVRRLAIRQTAHDPRYNASPAWPRAAFGLPIVARFQQKTRTQQPYLVSEPTSFELRWQEADGTQHDRLASPVILKPLALRDGAFAPIALWLDRAFPSGKVVAEIADHDRRGKDKIDVAATAAPFDRILADGDASLFQPLVGHPSVRDAFLAWILAQRQWSLVAGVSPK